MVTRIPRIPRIRTLAALIVLGAAWPSGQHPPASHAAAAADSDNSDRAPRKFVTRHSGEIGGKAIEYVATVEETFALNDKGQRAASLVSFSYVRTDMRDAPSRPGPFQTRPVIFAFNGGPGSASLWLHMGLLGPRRVLFHDGAAGDDNEEVNPRTTPPFSYGNNPDSLLDVADIVLFDPPGTGFSRVLDGADERQFYGVQQDARVTSDFIQDWVARNNRWSSPKFLMGESYGSIRAAVVARMLAGGPTSSGRMDGITLNGVVLLGQAMNMSSAIDIGVLNALPTLAATAWYHGKVDRKAKTLEQHVEDARAFAADELVRAFYAGSTLPASERNRVAGRLASLIGLSSSFILEHNLRIDPRTFSSELLKGSGRQLGLYDGRFTLPLSPSGGDPVADDPAMGQYVPSFIATFNDYVGKELEVQLGSSYNAIEFRKVNARWDYGSGPGVPVSGRNFAEDLAIAMRRNPGLKVFIGTGYYDLVATVGSAEYTIAHADIDRSAVSFKFYRSGHMPYIGVANRRAVTSDLRQFIAAASR